MKIKDYTLQDEKNSLETFLSREGIEYNHNYVSMRKGPKPFLFRMIAFSHQLRIKMLNNYFLVFTENCLILLSKDTEDKFNVNKMSRINYNDIYNFSFQRTYGYHCIFFEYLNEDYYFYLSDKGSKRLLDKFFDFNKTNYSNENIVYLEKTNFKGLLKK